MAEALAGRRLDWRWRNAVLSRQALRSLLGLLVAAAFGGVLLWRTDPGQMVSSVRDVRLPLLAAAGLLRLAVLVVLSLRWHMLIRHIGSPGATRLIPALAIGNMGSAVLPFSLGGVLRAHYVQTRYGIAATSSLSSIVLENILDALVLAGIFIPALAILGVGGSLTWTMLAIGGVGAGVLVLMRVLLSEGSPGLRRALALPLAVAPRPLAARMVSCSEEAKTGLRSVQSTSTLAIAVLLTIAARLVTVGVHLLVGLAFGLDIHWTSYLVVTAAANASGFVALSQGNVGPYEIITAEVVAGLGAARGDGDGVRHRSPCRVACSDCRRRPRLPRLASGYQAEATAPVHRVGGRRRRTWNADLEYVAGGCPGVSRPSFCLLLPISSSSGRSWRPKGSNVALRPATFGAPMAQPRRLPRIGTPMSGGTGWLAVGRSSCLGSSPSRSERRCGPAAGPYVGSSLRESPSCQPRHWPQRRLHPLGPGIC